MRVVGDDNYGFLNGGLGYIVRLVEEEGWVDLVGVIDVEEGCGRFFCSFGVKECEVGEVFFGVGIRGISYVY